MGLPPAEEMTMRIVSVSPKWTVDSYMNLIPECGQKHCDEEVFPVILEDGSHRAACIEHLRGSALETAEMILEGILPLPGVDDVLKTYGKVLRTLHPLVQVGIMQNACKQIRQSRLHGIVC